MSGSFYDIPGSGGGGGGLSNVVIYDQFGNPVGVIFDGSVYRLAVDASISGTVSAELTGLDTETMGNREALAISYPEMLKVLERISSQLDTVLRHLAIVSDESDPM